MNFMEMVRARQDAGNHACIGLDSVWKNIPEHLKVPGKPRADVIFDFNRAVVDATVSEACTVKVNAAPYSTVQGDEIALGNTVSYIHAKAPGVPVILDGKRADIGNTNKEYAAEMFVKYGADATTVNPYFGQEGLQPFLDYSDKGIIVLCRTSNKGAEEFQSRQVLVSEHQDAVNLNLGPENATVAMYEYVAMRVATYWNKSGNCALVVGATAPSELARVRQIVGDMQILIPGIGAQGGDLEATVKAGVDKHGSGMIINSSRGIIFASSGEDYAEAAGREARKLNDAIKACIAATRA